MLGARTGAWSGKRIPYMRRVKYLESDSNSYIVIHPGNIYSFTIELFGGVGGVIGQWNGGSQRAGFESSESQIFYRKTLWASDSFDKDGNYFYYDSTGKLINGSNNVTIQKLNMSHGNLGIFCYAYSTTSANTMGNAKVGRVVISGLNDYDLIPVLDISGRPAMYDEVSGQFFYSQGNGEFAWGELET